jgi:epoxyqueuosine reductase
VLRSSSAFPEWLMEWVRLQNITLWGAADLRGFSAPRDAAGREFSYALSWVIPLSPQIMAGIQHGPNQAYADEYARVNNRINEMARMLSSLFSNHGIGSRALAASDRTDTANIRGDFPHKTAATRAGLGWIGRHCQLITRNFGPWVRLGTVFVELELPCSSPIERNYCGTCTRCVDACPAKALKGAAWHAGLPREEMLDVQSCDRWKKEHYFQYHRGHNCGICAAVCPYGLKIMKKKTI